MPLVAIALVSALFAVEGPTRGDYWHPESLLHGPQCRPHHRGPASLPAWARPRRMTVLTDSVLLGATPTLRAAKPCWRVRASGTLAIQVRDGVEWLHQKRVAPLVVIGLGNNSSWERHRAHYGFWAHKFDADSRKLLKELRRRGARQFVWLTVRDAKRRYVPRQYWPQIHDHYFMPYVNERLRRLDRSRDDLVLADWDMASRRPGLTYDTIHVNGRGARLMTRTIRTTIDAEASRQAREDRGGR